MVRYAAAGGPAIPGRRRPGDWLRDSAGDSRVLAPAHRSEGCLGLVSVHGRERARRVHDAELSRATEGGVRSAHLPELRLGFT